MDESLYFGGLKTEKALNRPPNSMILLVYVEPSNFFWATPSHRKVGNLQHPGNRFRHLFWGLLYAVSDISTIFIELLTTVQINLSIYLGPFLLVKL